MAYCTNPDCRHRQRTGKPAEYQPGTPHCADCGEPLEPGERPKASRPPGVPWPRALTKRVGITVAAMALATALAWVPHPLLNMEMQAGMSSVVSSFGPFALGVRPLLVGLVLVELVALILPFTRHRRCQDPSLRRTLFLLGVIVGVGLAWFQGISLAFALENINGGYSPDLFGGYDGYSGWDDPLVTRAGWMFRLTTAFMCAGGVGCLAVVVRWLDRHGLGPGMAALLLADALVLAGHGLIQQGRYVVLGESSLFYALLLLAGLGLLAAATWWLLGRPPRGDDALPACLPVTGLFPYEIAISLLLIPSTLAAFGLGGSDQIMDFFTPGGGPWLAVAIPTVLLATPVAATLFYWRRRHWWTNAHRARWLMLLAASAGMMLVLVLLDAWLMHNTPMMAMGGVIGWITLVALLGDGGSELAAWRRIGGEPTELARHQDMADALAQLRDLQAGDPEGDYTLVGQRFRALTYFFGPYVPLRIIGAPSAHHTNVES